MEEYINFEIEDFGIFFSYPEWWDHRLENGGTYLFWDEYVGSLRITPMLLRKSGKNLTQMCDEELAMQPNASRKQIGSRIWVVSQKDSVTNGSTTRSHAYLGGDGDCMLICTYAYDLALLEDDFGGEAVEAGLEEVEILLEGMRFGEEE